MDNIVVKPPKSPLRLHDGENCFIFLAGSIEMGKAKDWQSDVVEKMSDVKKLVFLNPRRDDWDSSWEQKASNPQFNQQVVWELDNLHFADFIVMYLQPGTLSPISLLELGLYAKSNKIHVCCPDGFWRKGNIEVVCRENRIPLYDNLDDLADRLKFIIGYSRQGEFE